VPLFGLSVPAPLTYYAVMTSSQARRPVVRAFREWLVATFY